MRVLLAVLRCEKGDIAGNLAAQLRLLAAARSAGCDLARAGQPHITQVVAASGHILGVQRKALPGRG